MPQSDPTDHEAINVPHVSGAEAAEATDLIEHLIEKYTISNLDIDALFNAMVAIYIRGKIVYGDRQLSMCSLAGMFTNEPTSDNN